MKSRYTETIYTYSHKCFQKTLVIILTLFLVSSVTQRVFGEVPGGKKVLGLYRSSEGYSEKNNPLVWFFQKEIHSLGLSMEFHDFSDDVPDLSDISDVRAIVTWFNGGVVEDKKKGIEYAEFLRDAIDRGIKVVIVNSYGAYGYMEDGKEKWDLMDNYIRPVFLRLGFNFLGFWTNDPSSLKIVNRDASMVEKEAKQNVNISRHYQQVVPVRDDVQTYLTIQRKDRKDLPDNGNSSVILTSRNGGFAMEQYVLQGKKTLLNMNRFIKSALFYDNGYQNMAVIVDDELKNASDILNNITWAFRYAKIMHDTIDIDTLKNYIPHDLQSYESIVLAVEDTASLPAGLLETYVKNGGRLVFIRDAKLDPAYRSLLGIKSYSDDRSFFKQGFTISSSFFMNNASIDTRQVDLNVKRAELISGKVIAKAEGAQANYFPVMWTRSVGKGMVLYWNTDLLVKSKNMRGTIVQSMHQVSRPFVTGVANIGMMMIDDFPAPWWNIGYREYRIKHFRGLLENERNPENRKRITAIIERLKKYPGMKDTDFIQNVWYNDIRELEKRYGFKYSSYLIFNYNKNTKGDSADSFEIKDFYLAEDALSVKMGKEVLRNGWELGFHGFNHMSLTTTRPEHYDSTPWDDREAMETALRLSRNEWISLYGKAMLPVSYVAPHNIIDDAGLQAIGNVFPEIRVVATLYTSREGERTQEFTRTPDNRFFQLPRITSGYYLQNYNRFAMYDALHNVGIVSHFIHPDDVFDESRSNEFSGWNWLKKQFIAEFDMLKKNVPWLRWMTVKDAYREMEFYTDTDIQVQHGKQSIKIFSSDGSGNDLYLRITLPVGKKVTRIKDCNIVFRNIKTGDLVVKTNAPVAEIWYR